MPLSKMSSYTKVIFCFLKGIVFMFMKSVEFNVWSIIILFAAFLGIYLGLMLWLKRENQKANRIFALIIFIFTFHLIETASSITGLINYVPHLSKTSFPFLFLMGPLLYYYSQHLKGNSTWNWKKALHLIPALGFLIRMVPYYLLDSSIKLKSLNLLPADSTVEIDLGGYTIGALFYLYNFSYILLVYRILKRLIKVNHLNKKTTIRTKWFSKVLVVYALFICSCLVFYLIMALVGSYPVYVDYIHLFLMALMIHVLGYFVINQPVLFMDSLKPIGEAKYGRSSLPKELSSKYIKDLYQYFASEKPYLREDLSLAEVAKGSGLSKHHLSLILNKELGATFYEFINRYRVDEAKVLMRKGNGESVKLIDIGFQAGFGNKVSFYRAFKKFEGVSPSDYMETISSEAIN